MRSHGICCARPPPPPPPPQLAELERLLLLQQEQGQAAATALEQAPGGGGSEVPGQGDSQERPAKARRLSAPGEHAAAAGSGGSGGSGVLPYGGGSLAAEPGAARPEEIEGLMAQWAAHLAYQAAHKAAAAAVLPVPAPAPAPIPAAAQALPQPSGLIRRVVLSPEEMEATRRQCIFDLQSGNSIRLR